MFVSIENTSILIGIILGEFQSKKFLSGAVFFKCNFFAKESEIGKRQVSAFFLDRNLSLMTLPIYFML
jgi:hypothetical protein